MADKGKTLSHFLRKLYGIALPKGISQLSGFQRLMDFNIGFEKSNPEPDFKGM
jgi:hypothetical protein